MAPKTNHGKNFLNSYTFNGTGITIKRGDCVLIKPKEPHETSYIARVEEFESGKDQEMMVNVRWYYRPEDAQGGRKSFHGEREVFLSNHYTTLSVDTIEGRCVVHTFRKYMKLESLDDSEYFYRYKYDASVSPTIAGERFSPKNVVVYCVCAMPYNPDIAMVQCDGCLEWYHLSCLDLELTDVEEQEKFSCFKCQ